MQEEDRSHIRRGQLHARQVAAYRAGLIESGLSKAEANELARGYATDLLFAAISENVERHERRKREEGEDWKG